MSTQNEDLLTELVSAQRRRVVATIMGHAEREFYDSLTSAQQRAFRATVLGGIGVFGDFVLDCIRSANKGSWVNPEVLKLLNEINDHTRPPRREE